jgi:hypothetical protein
LFEIPRWKERDKKACEKNNHRNLFKIPRIFPPKFGGGLFFEYNTACPVIAIAKTEGRAKRTFIGYYLILGS